MPLDTPEKPGTFNAVLFGGYRINSRASLFPAWDNSIPVADKTRQRAGAGSAERAAAAAA